MTVLPIRNSSLRRIGSRGEMIAFPGGAVNLRFLMKTASRARFLRGYSNVNSPFSRSFNPAMFLSFVSHSHTTTTRQPISCSFR